MKVRYGLVLVTAALFTGAGCAAPGGGTGGGSVGPVLPGGQVLEEGFSPRDNSHTRSADLFLAQAQATTDEVEAQGKYQEALQAAQEGITENPENPKSFFQAAQAMVGLGDYAGAADMFDQAEELHPRYILETEAWRERGWIRAYNDAVVPMNNQELEAAVELFGQAAALYNGRPEALLQLGSLHSRLDRTDDAIAAFREAIAILEETKEVEMADTAGAPMWQDYWGIATTGLGQSLTFAERYDEAAALFTTLLEENPDDVTVLGNLANVLSQLGQPDSVQALYDQLLSRDDLGERELFNAGVGLYEIENYPRAAMAFRRASEMNPFNRDAKLNLANTLLIGEDFEGLVPAARDLLSVDPRNQLGWIYLTRGLSATDQTEEANNVFNEFQDIGYEIADLFLRPDPNGGTRISGTLKNTAIEPGITVILRFHFGGEDTLEIGTLDIQIQTPDVEMSELFQADFVSTEIVTGYWYEVISP